MFSTEPIFIEASTDIVITRLVQLFSWCTFCHIGDLIYFRPFVLFLKNQSESLLKRIFRESLVSSSLRSKERRLEVRECLKNLNEGKHLRSRINNAATRFTSYLSANQRFFRLASLNRFLCRGGLK